MFAFFTNFNNKNIAQKLAREEGLLCKIVIIYICVYICTVVFTFDKNLKFHP